jgi:hypothetical protein
MQVLHMGYARKSRSGHALKLDIMLEAFLSAQRYRSGDGKEYVSIVVSMDKLKAVLDGKKDVTGLNQITGASE